MLVWDAIAVNKRNSFLLFFFFFLFVLALGWLFSEVTGLGVIGLIIAFIIAVVSVYFSYYYSDQIVLKISRARPATHEEYTYLDNVVEGLAIAAGIPKPKIYVIDDSAPNAFATGRDPEHAVICVTTGLLKKLNRAELEGVIAHEISHIKNYDIRFMTLVSVMVGLIALLSDWMLRAFWWGGNRREKGNIFVLVIAIVAAILAPIIATLIKLAISRQREFLADANAALLTRYPEGLASALEKLAKDKEPLEAANKATAHLYIVNPLKDHKSFLNNLFSTHPPIEERIKRLRSM